MKPRSGKNKGQRLQKFVVDSLRKKFNLDEDRDYFSGDIQARLMGGSGVDVMLSPHAEELIPFDIECKYQEKWSVESWFEQAIANTIEGRIPLLICKKNYHNPVVFIRHNDLMDLHGCEGRWGDMLIRIEFNEFLKMW